MRQSSAWGVVIGAAVAVVIWLGEPRDSGVSLFPDLLSLLVFAGLASFALDRLLRRVDAWKEAIRVVMSFGVSTGLVLGIATLQRGATSWSRVSVAFAAATIVGSLVFVLLLSCSIGFVTFYMKLRRDRLPAHHV